jgi:HEAT repeat protein
MSWPGSDDSRLVVRILVTGLGALLVLIVALVRAAFRYRFRNNRTRAEWERRERLWEPILLRIFAGQATDEELHRAVPPADRLYLIDYLLRFAHRLSGDEHQTLERLAAPYLPEIAGRVSRRDPEFRARAIQTLAALGLDRYGPVVAEALDDPSELVAFVAARSLARPAAARFGPEVLAKLGRFHQWRPSFLASMVAQFGPEIGAVLRATLGDAREEPGVRVVAAEALKELHDLAAADVAATALADSDDSNLRVALLGLLMDVGHHRHLDRVRPFVTSSEPAIRARAYATIARIDGKTDLGTIRAALQDSSPWVAIRVIEALRSVGATEALLALADHPEVRTELAAGA